MASLSKAEEDYEIGIMTGFSDGLLSTGTATTGVALALALSVVVAGSVATLAVAAVPVPARQARSTGCRGNGQLFGGVGGCSRGAECRDSPKEQFRGGFV